MRTSKTHVVAILAVVGLLASIVSPAFGTAAGFKDLSKDSVRGMYMEYLQQEGYNPEIDSDGDIRFKKEGDTFYVIFDDDDLEYLKILRNNFWSVESAAEKQAILVAADSANRRTKVAKVFLNSDEDNTQAATQAYISGPEQFALTFDRSLSALQSAIDKFVKKMRE